MCIYTYMYIYLTGRMKRKYESTTQVVEEYSKGK